MLASTKVELGDALLMSCGHRALVTKINNNYTINVMFDDGKLVENATQDDFINRCIPHSSSQNLSEKINESKQMNCGMIAKIINFRNNFDLDVKFVDGTIVYNITYDMFEKGIINNPNYTLQKKQKDERTHMTKMMNCGLKAKIVEYRKANDIDIMFEDGTVLKNQSYHAFVKKSIKHSCFLNGFNADKFYGFTNLSFSFRFSDYVFYCCTTPYGERKILTLQQMMKQSDVGSVLVE